MRRFGLTGTMGAAMILLGSAAHAEQADFDAVTDLGGGQYRVAVPGLGSLLFSYASSSGRNSYNGGSGVGFATPHFALDAVTGQISIRGEDFALTSATFTVWDLDTVSAGTETVTFNGGSQLVGVDVNIPNDQANISPNPVLSANIAATNGEIVVQAGPAGAAFALGGMNVQGTAIGDPACIEGGNIVRIDESGALLDLLGGNTVCGTSVLNNDQFQEVHQGDGRIFELGNNTGEIGNWEIRDDPAILGTYVVGYVYDGGGQYEYRLFQDGTTFTFCETGTGDGQTNGRANTQATIISSGSCGF